MNKDKFVAAQDGADRKADEANGTALGLRPSLLGFALAMEAKLRRKEAKMTAENEPDRWNTLPIEGIEAKMAIEIGEYRVARDFGTPDEARGEIVDVANFALMLWDRLEQGKKAASGVKKTSRGLALVLSDGVTTLYRNDFEPHGHWPDAAKSKPAPRIWRHVPTEALYYEDCEAVRDRRLNIYPAEFLQGELGLTKKGSADV